MNHNPLGTEANVGTSAGFQDARIANASLAIIGWRKRRTGLSSGAKRRLDGTAHVNVLFRLRNAGAQICPSIKTLFLCTRQQMKPSTPTTHTSVVVSASAVPAATSSSCPPAATPTKPQPPSRPLPPPLPPARRQPPPWTASPAPAGGGSPPRSPPRSSSAARRRRGRRRGHRGRSRTAPRLGRAASRRTGSIARLG